MSGQPIELTPIDFESKNPQKLDAKYKNLITIVKFYSPSCGYCVSSQPDYIKLATVLKDDKKYNIAQFDCSKVENKDIVNNITNFASGYTIEGYPTYIIFVNSLFYKNYSGARDVNSILNEISNINTLN